jgi:GTP-binding protein EngB required for normal cell division
MDKKNSILICFFFMMKRKTPPKLIICVADEDKCKDVGHCDDRELPSMANDYLFEEHNNDDDDGDSLDDDDSLVVKISLLGDSACGKSSILRRFTGEAFAPTMAATVGIDFRERKMKWQDSEGTTRRVKCLVWDTAGQVCFLCF